MMYLTPLFNNNAGLDALQLDNGDWLVVHNPVEENWVRRAADTPVRTGSSKLMGVGGGATRVREHRS